MTLKIMALAALMGLVTSTAATSVYAAEEANSVVASDPTADHNPGWDNPGWNDPGRNPGWDHNPGWNRGGIECFARNITGQTFGARGGWRMPAQWIQRRAVQVCQYNSGFFRFTCRPLGCRRAWH